MIYKLLSFRKLMYLSWGMIVFIALFLILLVVELP